MIEAMEVRLYEHENFVWLDHSAVSEVLDNRKPASSDPMVIYNNLLRWSLYQLDRNACVEIDDKTGNDIPLQERLNWIRRYKTVFTSRLRHGHGMGLNLVLVVLGTFSFWSDFLSYQI